MHKSSICHDSCALRARAERAHQDLAHTEGAAERSEASHGDERSEVAEMKKGGGMGNLGSPLVKSS